MNKVLLLGKGYIGNYLYKSLSTTNNVVWVNKQEIDYTNPYTLETFLDKQGFSWIINSSGYTGVPNVDGCESDKESCYYYNVTVPLFITKIANKKRIPIIHIGSGCVYTGYDKHYTEEDVPNFGYDCYESSFYSKTKHTFEKLSDQYQRYIFRIRIPFNEVVEPKNYLYKLHHYDSLISCKNSVTNVNDLVQFTNKFINPSIGSNITDLYRYSIFNVVNPGAVEAREVVDMFKKHGISNPNWKFVSIEEAKFKVARSNCILDSKHLQQHNLELPDIKESMLEAVAEYCANL